ncbi:MULTISPECIES: hypothetical protein [unclassified Methylophaga]|jgi:hypothetical protein|uniref:hypothetical protein n=1 Tax=unclassified Methylophaga TaxID=2629249 RepID=UPI00259CAEBE|nr:MULTISPECIES: hypothetical protein [unclassified Methylophaga]|tara:strand:+ start:4396 stop:5967 length:1572 start_codon:yes stop_codon:yes gene_type:complete
MHIESELEFWLQRNIPDKRESKLRNIKIVMNYYGFGDLAWPTLESIAEKLAVGTRERVRQIINANFRDVIALAELPVACAVFDIIEAYGFVSIPEVRTRLIREGYASKNTTLRGVLNLARDLGRCEGYNLYDSNLNLLKRSEAEFDEQTYLIRKSNLGVLKKKLRKAKTLPGLLGLSLDSYLEKEIGSDGVFSNVKQLIAASPEVVQVSDDQNSWYIFEDRDNTLINCCEKIFGLTAQCQIGVLASTLQNSLRRRSHKYNYPPSRIISRWIESSKWFVVEGESVKFLGDYRELTHLEKIAVSYLEGIEKSDYPQFRDHLIKQGIGKPAANKIITTSSLVTVDKTGQRKTYTYQLITKAGRIEKSSDNAVSRYQVFKNRLKHVLAEGTDSTIEVLVRREQAILREWLFGEKDSEHCAACGELFSISALVTAHKKKRSQCTDSERVDPNIVFPLCHFGCDYLYEIESISVNQNGVIEANSEVSENFDSKRSSALAGRTLPSKWLLGSMSYFKRNLTIANQHGQIV